MCGARTRAHGGPTERERPGTAPPAAHRAPPRSRPSASALPRPLPSRTRHLLRDERAELARLARREEPIELLPAGLGVGAEDCLVRPERGLDAGGLDRGPVLRLLRVLEHERGHPEDRLDVEDLRVRPVLLLREHVERPRAAAHLEVRRLDDELEEPRPRLDAAAGERLLLEPARDLDGALALLGGGRAARAGERGREEEERRRRRRGGARGTSGCEQGLGGSHHEPRPGSRRPEGRPGAGSARIAAWSSPVSSWSDRPSWTPVTSSSRRSTTAASAVPRSSSAPRPVRAAAWTRPPWRSSRGRRRARVTRRSGSSTAATGRRRASPIPRAPSTTPRRRSGTSPRPPARASPSPGSAAAARPPLALARAHPEVERVALVAPPGPFAAPLPAARLLALLPEERAGEAGVTRPGARRAGRGRGDRRRGRGLPLRAAAARSRRRRVDHGPRLSDRTRPVAASARTAATPATAAHAEPPRHPRRVEADRRRGGVAERERAGGVGRRRPRRRPVGDQQRGRACSRRGRTRWRSRARDGAGGGSGTPAARRSPVARPLFAACAATAGQTDPARQVSQPKSAPRTSSAGNRTGSRWSAANRRAPTAIAARGLRRSASVVWR